MPWLDAHAPRFPGAALFVLLTLASAGASGQTLAFPGGTPLTLASPDGHVVASVGVDGTGRAWYAVRRDDRAVIDPSPIGQVVDWIDLGGGVIAEIGLPPTSVDDTFATRGVHPIARHRAREMAIAVQRAGAGDAWWWLLLRVADDGVAYRYVVPGTGPRFIVGETSAWTLPAGTQLWFQASTGNYESPYLTREIGSFDSPIGGPLTARLPDGSAYLTLTEGALRRYSGMTYDADLGSLTLRGAFLDDPWWPLDAWAPSPWRIAIVSPTLDGLVNSDFVSSVNDPPDPTLFPDGARTAWIKPGRAVWSWWTDHDSAASFDTQLLFVEYAAALESEYVLVDAGWELGLPTGTADQFERLSTLVAYARLFDVGIWVWKDYTELTDAAPRQAFFRAVSEAGAAGVKIDHIDGNDSESFANLLVQEAILRDAAACRLMINLHGLNKATGLSRTYPNEITREGFMGLEANGFWYMNLFVAPDHNATLPFVRLVAGPGDYTPLTLDPRKIGSTTFTHQLAGIGLYTSPLLHFAEHPELLLSQPLIVDILRGIPTEWDQTIALPGSRVGELPMLARRKGDRWYVFAINGRTDAAAHVPIALDFLAGGAHYHAVILGDAAPTVFARSERTDMTSTDTLRLDMLPGGGSVIVLSPVAPPAIWSSSR
jgi:alpha-glucosidase